MNWKLLAQIIAFVACAIVALRHLETFGSVIKSDATIRYDPAEGERLAEKMPKAEIMFAPIGIRLPRLPVIAGRQIVAILGSGLSSRAPVRATDQVPPRSGYVGDESEETLAVKGQVLLSRGAIPEARAAFEQAFNLAKASSNVRTQAVALRGSGLILRYQGLNKEAEEKLQAALRLTDEASILHAQILSDIALAYTAQDEYSKAREALTQASRILETTANTDPAQRATADAAVGLACLQSGLRACAERFIRSSSSAAAETKEVLPLETPQILMAAIGADGTSLPAILIGGGSFRERLGDATFLGRDLRKAANNSLDLGNYSDGLRSLRITQFLFQAIGDVEDTASTMTDIGLGYIRLGAPGRAVPVIEQAASMLAHAPDREQARTLWALGLAHIELAFSHDEHWEKALEAFTRMRSLGEATKDPVVTANAADKQAFVLQNRDGVKAALPLLAQVRKLARHADSITEARVLNDIGRAYLAGGDLSAADVALRESLSKLHSARQYRSETAVLLNLGALLERKGKLRESIDTYARAISALEEYRGVGPELGFQRASDDAYRPLVRLLMSSGRSKEAFAVAESAHNTRRHSSTQASSASTMEQEPGLANVIDSLLLERISLERQIGSESASDPANRTNIDCLGSKYSAIIREYEIDLRRIDSASAMMHPTSRNARASELEQVQMALPEDLALVSYFDTGKIVYGFGIRRNAFLGFEVGLTSAAISQLIEEVPGRSLSVSQQSLRQLYKGLLNPVRDLTEAPSIAFIPSGSLCSLPFGALMRGDKYLIDDHTVFILPAASALVAARQSLPGGRGLLVLSDNEEPAASVADRVQRDPSAAPYGGLPVVNSTKSTFFAHAPHSMVVHISAKTFLDSVDAYSSRIVLSRNEATEDVIEPYELRNLDLSRVGLVILSNSERVPGATSFGEEAMVFPSALLEAGAATVVTNPWALPPDVTGVLLRSLFGGLNDGQGKAVALRNAQLLVRQTYPSPGIWAVFNIVGDPGVLADAKSVATSGVRITGILQAIDWPFLTVENHDGSRLRIRCLSNTRLRKGEEPASPAILQPGARIVVQATVDAETTFSAIYVEVPVSQDGSLNPLQTASRDDTVDDPFLRAAAYKAKIEAGNLPKFNAPFFTDRSVSSDDGLWWSHTDKISGQIVYIIGQGEVIRYLTHDRTLWNRSIMQLEGIVTSDKYRALRAMFDTSVGAHFHFQEEATLDGRAVLVYDFLVPEATTNLRLTDSGQSIKTGYHGTVWIDKANLLVWKIRYAADKEIPLSFPWRRTVTDIALDLMDMKAGGRFLLPKSNTETMCLRDVDKCRRNDTVFHDYQQFVVDVKIGRSDTNEKSVELTGENHESPKSGL